MFATYSLQELGEGTGRSPSKCTINGLPFGKGSNPFLEDIAFMASARRPNKMYPSHLEFPLGCLKILLFLIFPNSLKNEHSFPSLYPGGILPINKLQFSGGNPGPLLLGFSRLVFGGGVRREPPRLCGVWRGGFGEDISASTVIVKLSPSSFKRNSTAKSSSPSNAL